jgi:hypothetical protein
VQALRQEEDPQHEDSPGEPQRYGHRVGAHAGLPLRAYDRSIAVPATSRAAYLCDKNRWFFSLNDFECSEASSVIDLFQPSQLLIIMHRSTSKNMSIIESESSE